MQNNSGTVLILGTGGTIAGRSAQASDTVGYRAAELGVAELVRAVPALAGWALELEQVAQVDSKDMDHALWQLLAQRVAAGLQRPEVQGLVITHGTDTLEETAWFLQRVLAPTKPVVLTAAMRPASALLADGPQNLLDAVTVAAEPGARGVLSVIGGRVHGPSEVRKIHPHRLDAFDSGEAGAIASVVEGRVLRWRDWPAGTALGLATIARPVPQWPRVAIVCSHAGVDAGLVEALLAQGVAGLVVEGTGNGTLHRSLEPALRAAAAAGVIVRRASRCQGGAVVGAPDGAWPSAGPLTPARARIEILLDLLAGAGPAQGG